MRPTTAWRADKQTEPSVRVGLILPGPVLDPLPSTRIALLNIRGRLHDGGIETHVLHESPIATLYPEVVLDAATVAASGIQAVIFQKVCGPRICALARKLEVHGVRTVFVVCDLVDGEMAAACSATVCVTDHLASLYPTALRPKMHVVHDGIEHAEVVKTRWRADRGSIWRPLRAIIVTSHRLNCIPVLHRPPSWLQIDIVGRYPEADSWIDRARESWRAWHDNKNTRQSQLSLAVHPRIKTHAWHPQTVYRLLTDSDIALIPVDCSEPAIAGQIAPAWSMKSENRLTLKMAIGLPIVATPVPSYRPLVRQGENAFLAETREAWLEALQALRSPGLRRQMGSAARRTVIAPFSLDRQAAQLNAVLRSVTSQ